MLRSFSRRRFSGLVSISESPSTLPLLHLLHHCSERDRQMIIDRMETRVLTEEDLGRFLRLMEDLGSITYAMDRARSYIDEAQRDLELFEDSTATVSYTHLT